MTPALWVERMFAAAFLLAGLSHLAHPRLWSELFADLLGSRYAPLIVAAYTLPMGLAIVVVHNVWVWDVAVITTFAGWAMTIKSTIYLLVPGTLRKVSPLALRPRNYAVVGGLMTGLGVWMVWGAFLRA